MPLTTSPTINRDTSFQFREPVDETRHIRALIDRAVLRTEHVDLEFARAFAPIQHGFFRAYPAAVETFGLEDVRVESLTNRSVFSGGSMAAALLNTND